MKQHETTWKWHLDFTATISKKISQPNYGISDIPNYESNN